MADPLSVAASVIGIAAFGIQIVKTLTTFTNVYRGAEQKIKSLTANVALTSSILKSIGETIDTYEKECRLTVENFIATRDTCHHNFDVLLVALRIVKKESAGDEVAQAKKIDVWVKLKHALGGEQELKDLVASIETSKSNLQLLLDSLNLTILRSLSKKNLLSDEQADDFKIFMRHLPALVRSIQQAGLMPMPANKGKDKVEHSKDDSVPVTMYVVGPTVGKDDPPDYFQDEAKGVEDLTIATISPDLKSHLTTSEDGEEVENDGPAVNSNKKPSFKRRAVSLESGKDAKKDGTRSSLKQHDLARSVSVNRFQNEQTIQKDTPDNFDTETAPPKRRYKSTGLFGLFKEASDDSWKETPSATVSDLVAPEKERIQEPVAQQPAPSGKSPVATNIFEGWLLTPEILNPVIPSIIRICGLRIRIFTSQEPFSYKTSFLTRDETVLEDLLSNPNLDHSGVARRITNVAELPYEARRAVEDLLDDRNDSTNKPHGWKVKFISPYMPQQETKPYFWQRKEPRNEQITKWIILLRGGIVSPDEETGRDSFERYRDPWSDEVKLSGEELKDSDFILQDPRNMKKSQYRHMMEPEQNSSRGSQSVPVPVVTSYETKQPAERDWSGWAGINKKKKKTRVSAGITTAGENSKSSMPVGFDDDLDFAATVSAGLQDTGFDPDIVIDDPKYRRRDSLPDESEPKKVKRPHDLNYSPKSEGSGNEHYFEPKLSKREQKKRDKAARRSTLDAEDDARSMVSKPRRGWGQVAAGLASVASPALAEDKRRREELDLRRPRRVARFDSISSLGESDFTEESRWRRESSGHEEGSDEMLSEEQAEKLMSAYLDTFTADGGDE